MAYLCAKYATRHICVCVHDPLNYLSHKPHPLLLIWYLLSTVTAA